MVFMNYTILEDGVPKRVHLSDHYWVDRMIWDKDLGKEKPVRSLVFAVDREDYEPVMRSLSVLSNRLAAQFEPYLKDSHHRDFDFVITKTGSGFGTQYQVEAIPLGPDSTV